jgi:hypothetical protein
MDKEMVNFSVARKHNHRNHSVKPEKLTTDFIATLLRQTNVTSCSLHSATVNHSTCMPRKIHTSRAHRMIDGS